MGDIGQDYLTDLCEIAKVKTNVKIFFIVLAYLVGYVAFMAALSLSVHCVLDAAGL